ncbi:MAG: 4Fe-4S dicluster domain-containing protein [Holophagaceae bacterium]|nr:4Fe-4S dicluster domain-containing protein [Holophagaceae bacterium]
MPKKLDDHQDRGDFFKSLGALFGGFVAEQLEEAVTKISPKLLRPPGALDEFAFLTACTRCDKCIEACPQDSLLKAGPSAGLGLNTPYLEPRDVPCYLCTELPCITACPDGALVWPRRTLKGGEAVEGPRAVKIGTARVKTELCMTYGTEAQPAQACRTCVDRCPYPGLAIRIGDAEDGAIPHPEVIADVCTGCGLCVFGCPTPEPAIVVDKA